MTSEAASGAPAVGMPPMASPDPLMLRRTLVAGEPAAESDRSAAALRRVALMMLVTCSW